MKRGTIILTIVFLYLGLSTAVLNLSNRYWSASTDIRIDTVKAAETTNNNTASSIKAYPVFLPSGNQEINAGQYALYDLESGKIIFSSSDLKPVPIASTTKVMTTYLVSLNTKPDEIVSISKEAASQTGSLMGIEAGEKISVNNLLYGSLLVSGNDAVFALAEFVGGKLLNNPDAESNVKIYRFVQEMNQKAKELNLQNTHYLDPAGLNDEGRSNATDLAKLTSIMFQVPLLQQIIGTANITVYDELKTQRFDLKNSNRLLEDDKYDGIIGGKTGYTPDAGHCLVTIVKKNNHTIVAVILNTSADTPEASAIENRKLLDLGFKSTIWE